MNDPFDDREDRTVFIPNPGGRRQTPAAPPAPAAPSSTAPEARQVAGDWLGTPPPQPRADYARPQLLDREKLSLPHSNVMMRAAGPLLLLLGRLRIALMRASFAELMDQAGETITAFDAEVRRAGVPEAQARSAQYILCATADDIVQNIPSEDRHVWAQYSMLAKFFGERAGGVRFFQELDAALANPAQNAALLELFHACLALGFQGVHRTSPNGQATLQALQRRTYEVLKSVRGQTAEELSPRWVGIELQSRMGKARLPFWVSATLGAAALAGVYMTYWTLLTNRSEAAAGGMTALHPPVTLALYREKPPPPPPPPPKIEVAALPTQLQRIRAAMAPEIAAGEVTANATGSHIVVRVSNALLFDAGSADVKPAFKPLAARTVQMLEKEKGPIQVVGHTDSTPLKTKRFKSNFELSVARAKSVVVDLTPGMADPSRLKPSGRGEDQPVAGNDTPAGKAKNRRVEILIDRVD